MGTNVASSIDTQTIAREQQTYVVETRRALHKIPELGWQEQKTINYIKKQIQSLLPKINYKTEFVEMIGGLYVDITIDPGVKRTLFRADIDALPIEEKTELPFASEHPGIMHACGHDCHAAMLLGALRAIAEGFPIQRNLRMIWQRAEESVTVQSGGSQMVEDGICEGISEAVGLHISSTNKPGVFSSRPGIMMSNPAHLCIEIECSGGHVMHPELGSNAVDITTEIHVALKDFVRRTLTADERVMLVPSISASGHACNVMPDHATIWYSMRNFLEPERLHFFLKALHRKVHAIVSSFSDARITAFKMHQGYPMLVNSNRSYKRVKQTLESNNFKVETSPLLYSGEDFSYILEQQRGSFWILGAKQGVGYDHHTPLFNPDESVMWMGTAFWLANAS